MNSIQERIRDRAVRLNRTLVFPEGRDERIIVAAKKIKELGIADIILLGNIHSINESDLPKNLEILYPENCDFFGKLIDRFLIINKEKNLDIDEPEVFMKNTLNFGALMVEQGYADGCVCGAVTSSSDVIKAAIKLIGMLKPSQLVSSSFLMTSPNGNKSYTFADCGVVPNPTVEQLVTIAFDSAQTHEKLTEQKPKIGFLSYSTKGSANHVMVDKVRKAASLFFDTYPEYKSDGELQFDAAINPSVAEVKAPDSSLKGEANVLIFPDLDAGNLGYKIAQRFGRFTAWGPLLQGLKKPVMDLSRSCNVDDIVNIAAICAILKT